MCSMLISVYLSGRSAFTPNVPMPFEEYSIQALCRRHESERHRSRREEESSRKRPAGEIEDGRAREKEVKRSKERDASDVFKEKSTYAAHPDQIRERYGDVSRQACKAEWWNLMHSFSNHAYFLGPEAITNSKKIFECEFCKITIA